MHNVYSFNATVTSNTDKREHQDVGITADAQTLTKAWDKAERKVAHMFPNHTYNLSLSNRQPIHLRPGFRAAL